MQTAFNGIRHYGQQKRLHVVVSERGLNDRKNTAKKKKEKSLEGRNHSHSLSNIHTSYDKISYRNTRISKSGG
jgi:hypothetical protein